MGLKLSAAAPSLSAGRFDIPIICSSFNVARATIKFPVRLIKAVKFWRYFCSFSQFS